LDIDHAITVDVVALTRALLRVARAHVLNVLRRLDQMRLYSLYHATYMVQQKQSVTMREQMNEILNAPVCWIMRLNSGRADQSNATVPAT